MDSLEAIEALRGAKGGDQEWRDVASVLKDVIDSQKWADKFSSQTAWLEAVAEASGYSMSMLRRMTSVEDFVDKHWQLREQEAQDTHLKTPPFATMEVVKRIHDIDPDKAKTIIGEVAAGEKKFADVKEAYDGMVKWARADSNAFSSPGLTRPGTRSAGKLDARDFALKASKAVEAAIGKFGGDDSISFHFRRYKFRFAMPDAVAIGRRGLSVNWVDAYEFKNIGRTARFQSRHVQLLADIAFTATFFRHYWLVIPGHTADQERIVRDLRALELQSVGVMSFDEDRAHPLKVHLQPELTPTPDRSKAGLADVLEQGIPGMAML